MNILFLCPAAAVPTRGPRPQTWSGRARVHAEVRARDSWRERSSGSSFPSPLCRASGLMDTEVERRPSNVGRPHPCPRRERFRPSPRLRARVSPGPVLPPCAAVPCHGDPPGPGRGRVTAPVTAPAWHPTPASPSRLTGLAGGGRAACGACEEGLHASSRSGPWPSPYPAPREGLREPAPLFPLPGSPMAPAGSPARHGCLPGTPYACVERPWCCRAGRGCSPG